MIRIMLTVRNRLAMTKKCFQALAKHSKLEHQIYVYDNLSDYKLEEHFAFFYKLYEKKRISQVTFNTLDSTFSAFSKAAACNQFGYLHEDDPQKDKVQYLVFLDNDIIVTPGWDEFLLQAWQDVKRHNLKNVRIIGQLPGGIKQKSDVSVKIAGVKARIGKLGGSALWSVQSDFFRTVGYLSLKRLQNHHKRHDQLYWQKLDQSTKGKPYILGIKHKLGYHAGFMAGSVCNVLTNTNHKPKEGVIEKLKFADQEVEIDKIPFDEFYDNLLKDCRASGW